MSASDAEKREESKNNIRNTKKHQKNQTTSKNTKKRHKTPKNIKKTQNTSKKHKKTSKKHKRKKGFSNELFSSCLYLGARASHSEREPGPAKGRFAR